MTVTFGAVFVTMLVIMDPIGMSPFSAGNSTPFT